LCDLQKYAVVFPQELPNETSVPFCFSPVPQGTQTFRNIYCVDKDKISKEKLNELNIL
jgi:hypothetical protein